MGDKKADARTRQAGQAGGEGGKREKMGRTERKKKQPQVEAEGERRKKMKEGGADGATKRGPGASYVSSCVL